MLLLLSAILGMLKSVGHSQPWAAALSSAAHPPASTLLAGTVLLACWSFTIQHTFTCQTVAPMSFGHGHCCVQGKVNGRCLCLRGHELVAKILFLHVPQHPACFIPFSLKYHCDSCSRGWIWVNIPVMKAPAGGKAKQQQRSETPSIRPISPAFQSPKVSWQHQVSSWSLTKICSWLCTSPCAVYCKAIFESVWNVSIHSPRLLSPLMSSQIAFGAIWYVKVA